MDINVLYIMYSSLSSLEDTTLFPPIEQRPVLFDQRCVAGTDRFSDVFFMNRLSV